MGDNLLHLSDTSQAYFEAITMDLTRPRGLPLSFSLYAVQEVYTVRKSLNLLRYLVGCMTIIDILLMPLWHPGHVRVNSQPLPSERPEDWKAVGSAKFSSFLKMIKERVLWGSATLVSTNTMSFNPRVDDI